MRARFTQSFKLQAVEKVLNRPEGTSIKEIAESLGVGHSTLQRWIVKSRDHEFETDLDIKRLGSTSMIKEKRPQDWSLEERLEMVISCATLEADKLGEYCRERGLYPHHIKQWKLALLNKQPSDDTVKTRAELKALKHENTVLKKEVSRKDKALAETAALLVLQKKVNAIWGNDEDNSQ